MSVANGFPQIHGFFYSVFDPEQGSKIVIQVPEGCVNATPDSQVAEPFVEFDAIKNYIIPKPHLCNSLVSICFNEYKVMGYPVNLTDSKYERNTFTFNFAFIFRRDVDSAPYESVILRTAKLFKAIEEQNQYLSDHKQYIPLKSAMEQMFQDLNSFSECQIPIDDANKIDIKLFPILEAPPQIQGSHVPIATVKLQSLIDESWDPTLERLVKYVNGINSVRRIADLASADYELTKKGIQHLVHYDCVTVVDIFQFSNCFATTPAVQDICDPKVFKEFQSFVYKTTSSQITVRPHLMRKMSEYPAPHREVLNMKQVFKLYTSFQNTSLKSWIITNKHMLKDVDLNRFLTFGVLKRFIYVVKCYPLWRKKQPPPLQIVEKYMQTHGLALEGSKYILDCMESPMSLVDLCTELRANQQTVCDLLNDMGEWTYVYK